MSVKELSIIDIMTGREKMYGELSMMFSLTVLGYERIRIISELLSLFVGASEMYDSELTQTLGFLKKWLKDNSHRRDCEELKLELAREHAAYFAFSDKRVPDNASALLSKKRLIKRDEWKKCKSFYRSFGFKMSQNSFRLEDSIEVQCSFIESLIKKSKTGDICSIKASLKTQLEFIDEHMLVWIEKFGYELKEKAGAGSLYGALAYVPYILVSIDREIINEVLNTYA